MVDNVIVLDDVSKIYKQGKIDVKAVNNLSLEIERGEFAVLCGPSGSGKTTILNMIGGLDIPTLGRIFLERKDLSLLSGRELAQIRRDRIGFVFQAYNLVPVLTAFENAEFVLALQNVSKEERHYKVMTILAEVGLEGLENRRPDELSGGQQQRVAIARAIVSEPAIILADEPTANVDSVTAESLIKLMEDLNKEKGITFLFSTHDQRVIDRGRRIIRLRDGALDSE